MRGQILKLCFPLIITLLCFGSLLASFIWSNNNVEPHRLPPLKRNLSQLSEPCKGCMEVLDKVAESKTEISKKQEDKPEKNRQGNDKPVEQKSKISKDQEDNPQKVKESNNKAVKQHSKISKKQEVNLQKVKEGNDKTVEQHSKILKKQEDSPQKVNEIIHKAIKRYFQTWKKQEDNYQQFRLKLSNESLGIDKAIITQNNKPVGSNIVRDGDKTTLQVTPELFSIFMKDNPLSNKTLDTCAVVGNGGILINSNCGEMIDSAQFVIRCNLAPLGKYKKHVGTKTDLVTANPSIFRNSQVLNGNQSQFVESLRDYGNSLLLISALSFSDDTLLSLGVSHTIQDFKSPIRPVFLNPEYLSSLLLFWRSQGLSERRLSTGLITASLALELCNNVHLYGFWPFSNVTNHYYDDIKPNKLHVMPAEFDLLMTLHSQGVLRLHLENCPTSGK